MTIRDALLQFDNPFNGALGTGTYNSNNIIDLGSLGLPSSASGGGGRDLGIGDDPAIKVSILVTTAFTSGGAGTLQVNFQGAPDNGSGAPGTWSTFVASATFALATLASGARLMDIDVPRPPPGVAPPRFLRLTYVIGGAAMTAGALISELLLDRFDQPESAAGVLSGYPAGITVAN